MSFDFIAPHYRWLENIAFANSLQNARVFFLDQLPPPQNVLIAGEGDGGFLREFSRRFPQARVDCIDDSSRMLELAQRQLPVGAGRVRFLQNDLLTWSPEKNHYDLIVTHFFLDCFDRHDLGKIVTTLAKSTTQNATWLLADFSVPGERLRKLHARIWLCLMHRFFRMTAGISARRLTDPSPFLSAHGFRCEQREDSRFGLVKSEMWRR